MTLIPAKQRREITEYNHLLSTLRTEATADISSQMLSYLGTQSQSQTDAMEPPNDTPITETGTSPATARVESPQKKKLSGKMDRVSLLFIRVSALRRHRS